MLCYRNSLVTACVFRLFLLFLLSLAFRGGISTKKAVKIVQEPANYGGLQSFQPNNIPQRPILKPFRQPAPFSGPYHLRKLHGKCFSLTDNSYVYELCPFHNITQHEQTWRWNAFQGILGVWKEWLIVNNTFEAMVMSDGDECPGHFRRQSKIFLKCGKSDNLVSVREPSTCKYEFTFETPLGCPVDALLVYPMLSPKAQKEWEEIEESLYNEELTIQGYNKERHRLFVSVGLLVPHLENEKQTSEEKETPLKTEWDNTSFVPKTKFNTKEECFQAYSELLHEYLKLRQLLEKQSSSEKIRHSSQISNAEFPTRAMLRARGDSGVIKNQTDVRALRTTAEMKWRSTEHLSTGIKVDTSSKLT